MKKIVIFGNSGSGKSTLAKQFSEGLALAHLDLDTIAWANAKEPSRKPLKESEQELREFIKRNPQWVVEGCYSDLLELVLPFSSEIIYLNLPVELCIENAKNRPWEPHKYSTKKEQDKNLDMLIEWIAEYPHRDDVFSQRAHTQIYDNYKGDKRQFFSNDESLTK